MGRFFTLLALLACWSASTELTGQPVDTSYGGLILEAKGGIAYEDENSTLKAHGGASLSGEGFLLLADSITWNRRLSLVNASGSTSLTSGDLRLLADTIMVNLEDGAYSGSNVRGGFNGTVFEAKTLESFEGKITVQDVRLHPFEPTRNGINLSASKWQMDQNLSKFILHDPRISMGDFVIGKLPKLSGDFNASRRWLGSKFRVGKEDSLGTYAGSTFTRSLRDGSFEGTWTLYGKRGLLLEPGFSWSNPLSEEFFRGTIEGGWINDQAIEGIMDSRNQALEPDRGYAHLGLSMRPSRNFRLSSLVEWQNDSEFMRDFRRDEFESSQWNQSHAEMTYEGPGYSASVFTEWQINRHDPAIEQLPMLRIQAGPRIGAGLHHTTRLESSRLRTRDGFGRRQNSLELLDLGYKVEKPFDFDSWFRFTPGWSIRHTNYSLPDKSIHRTFGESGLDLRSVFHRRFHLTQPLWQIQEVLHLVEFFFSYRKNQLLSGKENQDLPELNPLLPDLNLAPIDLLDYEEHQLLCPDETVRIGWENGLLAKWRGSSRILANSRTYLDFNAAGGKGTKRSLFSEISISPLDWMSFQAQTKLDLHSQSNLRQSYATTIKDGRFQQMRISYVNYLDENDHAEMEGRKLLNEKTLLSARFVYDMHENQMTYLSAGLDYKSSSNWTYECSISERKGTKRENNLQFNFGITISDPFRPWLVNRP